MLNNKIRKYVMEELGEATTYSDFRDRADLEDFRAAYNANRTIGVAFVKKDGTIRHMALRKNLSTYTPSQAPKTQKQLEVKEVHNLIRGVDINLYIKQYQENIDGGMNDADAKSDASKKAWRSIKTEDILGVLYNGTFKDLRQENNILQKYGQQIHDSLTKSMVRAMNQNVQDAENEENQEENQINENNKNKKQMKKVIKLTEAQLTKLIKNVVKRALNEQVEELGKNHKGFVYQPMNVGANKFVIKVADANTPNDFGTPKAVFASTQVLNVDSQAMAVLNKVYSSEEEAKSMLFKVKDMLPMHPAFRNSDAEAYQQSPENY